MQALQALVPLAVTFSLAALIVAVGLDADWRDLTCVLRRPLRLAKAVLAVNVVVPLAAIVLVSIFPLAPPAKAGILLMAVSPVPPLVPGKELKVGTEKAYAYGLYVALILLAVAIVPLAVEILGWIFGADVSLPPAMVARNVALSVLLPLALGLLLRRIAPGFAKSAAPAVRAVSMILLLVVLVPIVVRVWPAMMSLVGDGTGLAMALMAAVALAAGHLLGGPDPGERAALAISAATRHPGIALMIANFNFDDKRIAAAIIGVMLTGLIVAVPYQLWLKRRQAGQAASAAGPA